MNSHPDTTQEDTMTETELRIRTIDSGSLKVGDHILYAGTIETLDYSSLGHVVYTLEGRTGRRVDLTTARFVIVDEVSA